MQRTGLEWIFRLLQEPRRLFHRYVTGLWVFGRTISNQWWQLRPTPREAGQPRQVVSESTDNPRFQILRFGDCLTASTIDQAGDLWLRVAAGQAHLLLDVSEVQQIDSTGVGMLLRLRRRLSAGKRELILIAPSRAVSSALALMRVTEFIPTAADVKGAQALAQERVDEQNVEARLGLAGGACALDWRGDIVAANAEEVWRVTQTHLEQANSREAEFSINLSEVRFIDSTGVQLMVRVRKAARQRGTPFRFTHPQPAVLNVLRLLGMETYLLK
jgi:N-acetylglucosaminyldiphosphoundecaprenol N-acetyl-beta-D-mannosaminyltransferase